MAFHQSSSRRAIYLDYAASTPIDPRVLKAMQPYFGEWFGNPGSLHSFGQHAIAAVDASRELIAKAIGAEFREIIFTGSATEANNMALRGTVDALVQNVKIKDQSDNAKLKNNHAERDTKTFHFDFSTLHFRPKVVVSAIEHESILETARDLERSGIEVVYLPVDRKGTVNLKKLGEELDSRTVLVSIMYANNEIGTVQPIAEIANLIKKFKTDTVSPKTYNVQRTTYPLLHTDAVQAFQFLDCNVDALGVAMMTLSAHKIYGPKGIGALYVRNLKHEARNSKQIHNSKSRTVSDFGIRISNLPALSALVTGGGQEFGMRSGTENVPSIVGFGKAVELISNSRELENKKIGDLRTYFWRELKKICPKARLNGQIATKNELRANQRIRTSGNNSLFVNVLPNILNVYFPDHEAQDLLMRLDLHGLAVSAGSACSARSPKPSHVLSALGLPKERALRSIRVSFGKPTAKQEIDRALTIFKNCF